MSIDFEKEGTTLKNQAAYREFRRILNYLPDAIQSKGMVVAMREGAKFLRDRLKSILPRSEMLRNEDGQHLADTGRFTKGRLEYWPSFLVKFGNRRARHYHLLEFGFRKRGGKGRVEGRYILNDGTQRALPEVDEIVAQEVVKQEPAIIREVNNPTAFIPRRQV